MQSKDNLQRETLRKYSNRGNITDTQKELASLKIQYSEYSHLLSNYINKLVNVNRIHPRHLPTQASGRWSTFDPPLTNFPRACINPDCIQGEHEWTEQCWSIRDIVKADSGYVLIIWDHDNIEGKIHDIIVDDHEAIQAHKNMHDLHTITCCKIFGYDFPADLCNPHTSTIDKDWRAKYNWQGKDTKQRVLAKNFNHGSKYTESYKFVHKIQGIEKYGISYKHLEQLARAYIESKSEAWKKKLLLMSSIRRKRIAYTLYGGRRVFYDSSSETGREGFSHMISGTVSDYNNITLNMIEEWLKDDCTLLHNAHDGNKIAVKSERWYNEVNPKEKIKEIIERPVSYQNRALIMTAGIKVYS